MTETQQLLLRREHLLEETLLYYIGNIILKCRLCVKFENEIGEDMEGIT